MTVAIKKQLDESLRDAQLAFYLNEVVPNNATTKNLELKTAEDLYEHWLLDVLVSQDVPTTPVACAIASLQQYIHRILMNMEPGYDSASITAEHRQTWRNEMHQYPTWAAHQKLLYFPAAYLDPLLRADKSNNFQRLENDLNQNRIQPDAVQSAVMAYLTRFEEVANLNILNGYIDGEDFANSTYYFIAKSRSENTYFWRSLDMAQRPFDGTPPQAPAAAPKLDQPNPFAWSDWEKADVPISDNAVEHSIRPVWFNNRLFVVWAECIHQDPATRVAHADSSAAQPGPSHPLLRLSLCYKKQDGSWSTPRVCLQGYCEDKTLRDKDMQALKPLLSTVATHYQKDSHHLLFLALCLRGSQIDSASHSIFIESTCIDKHLSHEPDRSGTSETSRAQKYFQYPIAEQKLLNCSAHRIQAKAPLQTQMEPPATGGYHHSEDLDNFMVTIGYPQSPPPRHLIPEITDVRSSLGTTQRLDFSRSAIDKSDAKDTPRQPIRLNTVFAAELIRRTENGLDELFDQKTQYLPEPALSGTPHTMDFHGPYGRYFTELFLYLPWLVAHRLNAEHRYEEAEHWLRHVFDPGRAKEDCWRAVPLVDSSTPGYSSRASHDPHQIALSHPVHFRKALYFLYIDILINRGDAAYRALTPDSLSEAKLWYVRAQDLLGSRPQIRPVGHWAAISLKTLSETTSNSLRAFEQSQASSTADQSLPLHGGHSAMTWSAIDSPHLRLPFNPELLKRWDIIESRLYNLRHNLDIAGKPMHLPSFAPALDPRALPSAYALSIPGSAAADLTHPQIPHYRFTVMHGLAQSAVESVIQFGATLLSLIERKEQAQLQEVQQQQQAWALAKMSVDLQRQALTIDHQQRQTLLASKAIVQGRASHYKKLLEDGVSTAETKAGQYYTFSGMAQIGAMSCQIAAGAMMLAPNVFGFSNGGSRWEGPLLAASAAASSSAIASRMAGEQLDRMASFDRRLDEWLQARDQAQLELAQIDAQLAHFSEQETATRLQLRLAESTLSQAKANYDFLSKRFTQSQLYQWLNSQFATLYRQVYDATQALCLAAEACWQYEIADFSTRFIQPGSWNATYRGLGGGEQLKLSLLNMQAEYVRRNERALEIRKTVSLRQLKSKTTTSKINKDWADLHADLKEGNCEFELTHELFEDDYKQHYLRRIKTISVSLPAIVGPYENIRAMLTQTASKVVLSPNGQYLESRRANQQIALSTGVDDNGLFTLIFNDERYLPFEYTGAISTWQLTFPNPEAQQDMLGSLTDIIVHVSYTARVGGGSL